MEQLKKHNFVRNAVFVGIPFVIVVGLSWYGIREYRHVIASLDTQDALYRDQIDGMQGSLDTLKKDVYDLQKKNVLIIENLLTTQSLSGTVAAQIGQLSNTVTDLKKLSETDPELLKKYSKVYFLNEHYVPIALSPLDTKYQVDQSKKLEIHSSVAPRLTSLLDAALASGLNLRLASAYRSFGTQAQLKTSYKVTYGAGTANQFSADQGYSEHQLGTTIDFTTVALKGGLGGFDKTPEYAWLVSNAHRYGFILSYPKNNAYYEYEPWHWRYVGVSLATKLSQEGGTFYTTDQRAIDGYLATLFD